MDNKKAKSAQKNEKEENNTKSVVSMIVAVLVGIAVPLQMVSQTWDDHDRSGRYVARDFGMNYLSSLDENAIIFTNGDNDTFPLWYAQEVEGYRTDVRVVNLSYLTQDWYANQLLYPTYNAPAIDMQATRNVFLHGKLGASMFVAKEEPLRPMDVFAVLDSIYKPSSFNAEAGIRYVIDANPEVEIPVNIEAAVRSGRVNSDDFYVTDSVGNVVWKSEKEIVAILTNMNEQGDYYIGYAQQHQVLPLDMIATSFKNGWDRPIYFAMTVPGSYYIGLQPYLYNTGMAYEVQPYYNVLASEGVDAEKMYRNITERFRWGGLENIKSPDDIYLDETTRRMVVTTRASMLELSSELIRQGEYDKAREVLHLMEQKLPQAACDYSIEIANYIASVYAELYEYSDMSNPDDEKRAARFNKIVETKGLELARYAYSLSNSTEPIPYGKISNEDIQSIWRFAVANYDRLDAICGKELAAWTLNLANEFIKRHRY